MVIIYSAAYMCDSSSTIMLFNDPSKLFCLLDFLREVLVSNVRKRAKGQTTPGKTAQ